MTNLIATIVFTLTTNWTGQVSESTTCMWPPEANTTTYTETGVIYSNKVYRVNVEKKVVDVNIDSKQVGKVFRSYIFTKPEKRYTSQWVLWDYQEVTTNMIGLPISVYFITNLNSR